MGGYSVVELIADEADPNRAWERLLAEQAAQEVWWACDPNYLVPGYRLAEIEGHLSVEQVESGAQWHLVGEDGSRFDPLWAAPIGATEKARDVVVVRCPARPLGLLKADKFDPARAEARYGPPESTLIEQAWRDRLASEGMLSTDPSRVSIVDAEIRAVFTVEVHTPIGEPTGWVFWGWVNG